MYKYPLFRAPENRQTHYWMNENNTTEISNRGGNTHKTIHFEKGEIKWS